MSRFSSFWRRFRFSCLRSALAVLSRRRQIVQGGVQPLVVVEFDDLADDLPGLRQIRRIVLLVVLPHGAVEPLDDAVVRRCVRPDQRPADARLAQRRRILVGDEARPVVALNRGPRPIGRQRLDRRLGLGGDVCPSIRVSRA